jgi:hypothetical protein
MLERPPGGLQAGRRAWRYCPSCGGGFNLKHVYWPLVPWVGLWIGLVYADVPNTVVALIVAATFLPAGLLIRNSWRLVPVLPKHGGKRP